MKPLQARNLPLLLVVLAAAVGASGCGFANNIRAKSALNDGAKHYKEGDFKAAEDNFRRALEINPEHENARMYLARAIERQYKPTGVDTRENDQKAQEALAAYRDILQREPNNEAAFSGVRRMLGYTKQTDEQIKLVADRANSESAPNDKRSEAFTFLASKRWKCANDVTEQPESKQTVQRDGKTVIEYKKPANAEDYAKAQQCATEGLSFAERAIALNPDNEFGYSYQANILLEQAKIAQMEGNGELKAQLESRADVARQKNAEITERKDKAKQAEEERKAQEQAAG